MVSFFDAIHAMLLTHERFNSFTSRTIPDPHATAQVMQALSEASRGDVSATVEKALAAGGTEPGTGPWFHGQPQLCQPGWSIWEVLWMDMEAARATRTEDAPTA